MGAEARHHILALFRRLHPEAIGLLIAVLVLGVATVATGADTARTAAVGAAPPAPATVDAAKTPTAKPLQTQTSAPRKPAARSSGRQSTQPPAPRTSQKEQIHPKPSQVPRKHQSQPIKKRSANGRGIVYLTFDDGPSQYTPAILQILRATHSTATFFELGFRQAEHPGEAAHVRAAGSNIGNHTYSHRNLTKLKAAEISSEVARGPHSRCVRPPFGATNPTVGRILARQGLRQVLWTVDTRDWSRPGRKHIVETATGPAVGAGSIVLMHDGGGDRSQTVAALPQIIATLQQRGYVVRRIPGC
jgi:peptidoglycan/xylan/chitin deacetylase (PgdA/CDA1 family)